MMSIYFPGASDYFILEGKARFKLQYLGSDDPFFQERIDFKENLINDLVARLVDANSKISMLLKHQSAEQALESGLIEDALQTNILEIADILIQFVKRLRGKIRCKGTLFKKSKKNYQWRINLYKNNMLNSDHFYFLNLMMDKTMAK